MSWELNCICLGERKADSNQLLAVQGSFVRPYYVSSIVFIAKMRRHCV